MLAPAVDRPRRPHGAADRAAVPAPDRHPRARPSRHRITGADVEPGTAAAGPRARRHGPPAPAGDRRADGRGRAARRRAPRSRSAFVDAGARTAGGPARGPRGPADVRACPGAALPARARARRSSRRTSSRRRVGAASRRSGAGRWRCSASAPAGRRARRRPAAVPAPRPAGPPRPRRRRSTGAAERIAELAEARELLLASRRRRTPLVPPDPSDGRRS